LTAVVSMKSPWVVFPSTLTAQTGVIPEPTNVSDDGQHPIGTGPFVQKEWVPQKSWIGTKNPSYWRKDKDGVQLPYLDEVEFRPMDSHTARGEALQSNDIQMMHTNDTKEISKFRPLAAD